MREIFRTIRDFCKKADMILLALCVAASVFGIVAISSATNFLGGGRYVRTQIIALVLGVICYILLTLIDVDIIAERRELLLLFCTVFIALLFKWGDTQQGNRSWLNFSFLPFSIQPAELCKIPFILILAKIMSVKQNKLSAPTTILQIGGVTIFLFVLIIAASEDLGVALQYIFIFVIMAFVGGVNFVWFLGALGALAAAAPTIWTHLSDDGTASSSSSTPRLTPTRRTNAIRSTAASAPSRTAASAARASTTVPWCRAAPFRCSETTSSSLPSAKSLGCSAASRCCSCSPPSSSASSTSALNPATI